MQYFYKSIKRIIDVVTSIFVLLLMSPLILAISLLVRINLGSPVLFKQERPGLDEKVFIMLKFRTMRNATNSKGEVLPDSERLTKFGQFLRKTSLDELPELINVLKGEMSLVGPRPLLVDYLGRYSPEQRKRHNVKPGITGWAQVNGRNSLSWEEKFKHDVFYTENLSLFLDLKILLMTVFAVLRQFGISEEGEATASPFRGSEVTSNPPD